MNKFQEFNQKNSLLVITSYPDSQKGIREQNAVAWHAQRTLRKIASEGQKIIVLAEKTDGKRIYLDGKDILVIRSWKKGNAFSFCNILTNVLEFRKIKNILFQFEFNIFGGLLPVLFIPALLFILRILGKRVHFELHQVLLDIGKLDEHVNIKNKFVQKLFNSGLYFFYFLTGLFSNQIIVLEEQLKERVKKFIPENKIYFLPIGIETKKTRNKITAKQRLGYKANDFVIMVFGFVNWYKGTDWAIKAFSKIKEKNTKLLVAGGGSPTLKDKKHYQAFYNKILKTVKENDKVQLTGFVEDQNIPICFSAADLVILPYRTFMSSSGPLSFAFAFGKPVLFSHPLARYFDSSDIKQAVVESGLSVEQLIFFHSINSFTNKLAWVKNKNNLRKLEEFSLLIQEKRNAGKIGKRYLQIINQTEIQKAPE